MTFDDQVEVTLPTGAKAKVHTGLLINGQFVKSKSGKKFPTVNPATGEVIVELYEAEKADIDDAVKAAKAAFKTWRHTDGAERGKLLLKFADLIEANHQTLAAVETLDQGKLLAGNIGHAFSTAAALRYFAGFADKIHGKTMMDTDKFFNFTRHEPYGVTAGIIPWNYPMDMWSWKVGPSVACGNVIIIKTSEKTPLSGLLLGALAKEAGFPDGVIQVVSGYGPSAGQAIVEHPEISKIAFTGSGRTGRRILETASKTNLKKVSLELGGKSPALVFDDADLDKAVGVLAGTFYYNNAQTCVASSRIYVQKGIADAFTQKFTAAAQAIKIGSPFENGVTQGPLVDDIQFNNVLKYIDAGKQEGKLLAGGNKVGNAGYFIEPTVFAGVPEKAKIMAEEIFGPVVCINTFETEDEVIERANNTTYGLAAGLFTKDLNRAIRVSSLLDAGTIWVNSWMDVHVNMPFGGYKESGQGRELGEYALNEWTQIKSVKINMA
ncbi:putative Iad1-indole-3-acetaldehyde dehydrogenase [Gonapodya prolifera JEL478]|uniref:Putative Iad1-indole-3-acetaldehyde dehydrogenase n=1 Tax=Gonapodya prolifera (strain JEL478) TaxID=1344416 RepID=A0A139A6Y6_GONPJ|nr:putative Iad1-indole-3-acetaldehyde dehydrogenase [Gonapodya prolifera JEL478]|eukprot:KXS12586.1 putative Iad1-indole-3-acetaldehyde dehydrogenase [Gonapodya prolifera JEL478]